MSVDHSRCLNISRTFSTWWILLKWVHHCTWLSMLKGTISRTICPVLTPSRELCFLLVIFPLSPSPLYNSLICYTLNSCLVWNHLLKNSSPTNHKTCFQLSNSTFKKHFRVSLSTFEIISWSSSGKVLPCILYIPERSFSEYSKFPECFSFFSVCLLWKPMKPKGSKLYFSSSSAFHSSKLLSRSVFKMGEMAEMCDSSFIHPPEIWTGPLLCCWCLTSGFFFPEMVQVKIQPWALMLPISVSLVEQS